MKRHIPVHPKNDVEPIFSRLLGKSIYFNEVQYLNAACSFQLPPSIELILFGSVMLVKLRH